MEPKKNEVSASQTPAIVERNICDNVLARVNQFQQTKEIRLPDNYSPENALKSAFLILKETVDRDKKPVLETCTKESIANSLLDMVVQGLSPVKKQCYFIAYGNKLQLSRSYQGAKAVAKRVGLKDIVCNVIYEGDDFAYEIDPQTGRKRILKHTQDFMSIDLKKIKGVYAIYELTDGTRDLELMNIMQIHNAWNQGAAKGNSGAHVNFTDEMCKKTVINRACKGIINASDDANLFNDDEEKKDPALMEITENANAEEIELSDEKQEIETSQPESIRQSESRPEPKADEATQANGQNKNLFDNGTKGPGF